MIQTEQSHDHSTIYSFVGYTLNERHSFRCSCLSLTGDSTIAILNFGWDSSKQ